MAKKLASTVSAFDVLIDPSTVEPAAVCVVVGDDGYVGREVRRALYRPPCGGRRRMRLRMCSKGRRSSSAMCSTRFRSGRCSAASGESSSSKKPMRC